MDLLTVISLVSCWKQWLPIFFRYIFKPLSVFILVTFVVDLLPCWQHLLWNKVNIFTPKPETSFIPVFFFFWYITSLPYCWRKLQETQLVKKSGNFGNCLFSLMSITFNVCGRIVNRRLTSCRPNCLSFTKLWITCSRRRRLSSMPIANSSRCLTVCL